MTMNCQDPGLRELLPDLAHGGLEADLRGRVEAHVAGCEACRSDLGIVRAARASLSRTPAIDTARIVASLPAAPVRAPLRVDRGGAPGLAPRRRWWSAPSAMRMAAGIAAIAVAGAGLRVALDGSDAGAGSASVAAASRTPESPAATPVAQGGSGKGPVANGAAAPAGSSVSTAAVGPAAMTFGGGVSDLTDEALHALLEDLEELDAVPSAEPEADLLDVSLEEG